jgi:hypothetical protein
MRVVQVSMKDLVGRRVVNQCKTAENSRSAASRNVGEGRGNGETKRRTGGERHDASGHEIVLSAQQMLTQLKR